MDEMTPIIAVAADVRKSSPQFKFRRSSPGVKIMPSPIQLAGTDFYQEPKFKNTPPDNDVQLRSSDLLGTFSDHQIKTLSDNHNPVSDSKSPQLWNNNDDDCMIEMRSEFSQRPKFSIKVNNYKMQSGQINLEKIREEMS